MLVSLEISGKDVIKMSIGVEDVVKYILNILELNSTQYNPHPPTYHPYALYNVHDLLVTRITTIPNWIWHTPLSSAGIDMLKV